MYTQALEFVLDPYNPEEIFLYITDEIVPNIKPWYLISNFGRVFSTNSNKFMKLTTSSDGYKVCTVRTHVNKGVTIYIHRVEMLVFNYQPGCEYLHVDHIDCDKGNNYISNLEWVTISENTNRAVKNGLFLSGEDAPWTKVSDQMAHQICALYVSGLGISSISRKVGCGLDSVFRIVHGIGRTNVSSKYDIESVYRGYLSDDEIHFVCQTYSNMIGCSFIDIKQYLSNFLKINTKIDSILRCLYRHDIYCFYRISSQYKY